MPMTAAVRDRYGPPEAVRIARVERPAVREREVLVRVRATTVNRTDWGYRAGKPFIVRFFAGLVRPRAAVLGCEFAGEIVAVAPGVTSFAVGDRVFGYREGQFGGHGQFLAIREDASLATVPAGMDFEQAAPCTEGAHYALSQLRAAGVAEGQDVLVYGATGAIGSAAVQVAKAMGAVVTAVCATAHLELVRGLGADRVVDYTAGDFTRDERRYDLVLDAVGKSTFGACQRLLKPSGVYLSTDLGPWGQNLLFALVTPLLRRRRVLFPIPKHNQAVVEYLRGLIESGQFTPVIDRTYPLERIVEAYRYVETGQKIGNVVITMPQENAGQAEDPGARQAQPEPQAATPAPNQAAAVQPVRRYRLGRLRRVGNVLSSALVRAGLLPHTYLLTTRGRKTGRLRRNPVTLVEHGERRWLVAPYGSMSWVHNARAAGRIQLTRRRTTGDYAIRELSPEQAGPVLKEYVHIARVTRPYFHAAPDAPAEDFAAEASLHPVFELQRLDER